MRGNEEAKLFKELARNPKYEWRSVKALAGATKLTEERIEEILSSYESQGIVMRKESNAELWGYWEIVKPELATVGTQSISQKDRDQRVVAHKAAKAKP